MLHRVCQGRHRLCHSGDTSLKCTTSALQCSIINYGTQREHFAITRLDSVRTLQLAPTARTLLEFDKALIGCWGNSECICHFCPVQLLGLIMQNATVPSGEPIWCSGCTHCRARCTNQSMLSRTHRGSVLMNVIVPLDQSSHRSVQSLESFSIQELFILILF